VEIHDPHTPAANKRGTMARPTREQFIECAELAQEYNELTAFTKLGPLLEKERNHAFLCELGVWYWKCTHNDLAAACYRRSLELHPEAPTYFNLAVCLDDRASRLPETCVEGRNGLIESALSALRAAFNLSSPEEIASAEKLLRDNGKAHLVDRLRRDVKGVGKNR
jgi:tetratricopeptide (TPR) repeat protein